MWSLLLVFVGYVVMDQLEQRRSRSSVSPGVVEIMEGEGDLTTRQVIDAMVLEKVQESPNALGNVVMNLELEPFILEALKSEPSCLDLVLARALILKREAEVDSRGEDSQ